MEWEEIQNHFEVVYEEWVNATQAMEWPIPYSTSTIGGPKVLTQNTLQNVMDQLFTLVHMSF
jgi:hypothetical protein